MNFERLGQVLLYVAVFLAPIAGGYVATDLQIALPGFSPVVAIFGSAEAPMIGMLAPTILAATALCIVATGKRVVQLPFPAVAMLLAAFAATILGSNAMTGFRAVSFATTAQWMAMLLPLIAVVTSLGRSNGSRNALFALSLGCAAIAVTGLVEYAGSRDPAWRVFCNWVNPNAAAGMLLMGIFPCCALSFEENRAIKLGSLACGVLIGSAMLLTQSKGGLLALGCGLTFSLFAGLAVLRPAREKLKPSLSLIAVLLLSFALVQVLQSTLTRSVGAGRQAPFARLSQADQTTEQSSGFRKMLWSSAIELVKRNPVGTGPGTFRYESSRPGLVSQTHHAHQGFLQTAVEFGLLGLISLVGLLCVVARESMRGATRLPTSRQRLLLGTMSSVVASIAHNFVDSDIQHFGTGFTLFALLGIALCLANDGSTPEFCPKWLRGLLFSGAVAVAVAMGYFSAIDYTKSVVRGGLASGDRSVADKVETLKAIASFDAETWALAMQFSSSRDEAVQNAARAAELGPSMRNERMLARLLFANGDSAGATEALGRALQRDPNNLPALLLSMQIFDSNGDKGSAMNMAKRLLAVESSTVFRIRAIPQSIPTQTYSARIFLAEQEPSAELRNRLLADAARGFARFAKTTVPEIVNGLVSDPNFQFAGDSAADAKQYIEQGRTAVARLRIAQGPGRPTDAELDELDGTFAGALGSLFPADK